MFTILISCSQSWYHVHNLDIMFTILISCSQSWYHVHNLDIMFTILISCSKSWYHVHNLDIMFTILISCSQSWYHVHNLDIMFTILISQCYIMCTITIACLIFLSSYYIKSKKEKAPKKDDKKGKKGKNAAAPPLDVSGQVKDLKEKVKFISETVKADSVAEFVHFSSPELLKIWWNNNTRLHLRIHCRLFQTRDHLQNNNILIVTLCTAWRERSPLREILLEHMLSLRIHSYNFKHASQSSFNIYLDSLPSDTSQITRANYIISITFSLHFFV